MEAETSPLLHLVKDFLEHQDLMEPVEAVEELLTLEVQETQVVLELQQRLHQIVMENVYRVHLFTLEAAERALT